ncbi:MAG: PadR family transcriptional regulator [Anaerolineae bacterium]
MSLGNEITPQPVLLGFLMPGPQHPYELHQEFERELGKVWRIGRSKLYAQLKLLEGAGLVTVQIEHQLNRPSRHMYHITAAGQETFLRWLHQPAMHARHIRLEFLARLYFFRRLALPGLEQLVTRQKEILQPRIESLSHTIAETDDDFEKLVLEFRLSQMEAVVRWLDCCQTGSTFYLRR